MQERVWRKGTPPALLVAMLIDIATMEDRVEIPLKTPLQGIYCEETKIEKDTCLPLVIAALFAIARTWKQPRCLLADEWIKKLCYIYTMEYYSDIKRNTFESVLMRWMNLEPIVQSEVSQKEKDKYCILMHIYGI